MGKSVLKAPYLVGRGKGVSPEGPDRLLFSCHLRQAQREGGGYSLSRYYLLIFPRGLVPAPRALEMKDSYPMPGPG